MLRWYRRAALEKLKVLKDPLIAWHQIAVTGYENLQLSLTCQILRGDGVLLPEQLRPRGMRISGHGGLEEEDLRAGDGKYVFLSPGRIYDLSVFPTIAFGWHVETLLRKYKVHSRREDILMDVGKLDRQMEEAGKSVPERDAAMKEFAEGNTFSGEDAAREIRTARAAEILVEGPLGIRDADLVLLGRLENDDGGKFEYWNAFYAIAPFSKAHELLKEVCARKELPWKLAGVRNPRS